MNICDIIGKEVITLEAENLGKITQIMFDLQLSKVSSLAVEQKQIDINQVYSIKDVVSCRKENFVARSAFNPLQKIMYTTKGERLGQCTDIEISNKFATKYVFCGEKRFSPRSIYYVGDVILIKTQPIKPISTAVCSLATQEIESVKTYSGDFSFLLNSVLTSDIFNLSGEIIAFRGQKVTRETIKRVRSCGKLVELSLKCERKK
ncbi:MAG: PRC-barrel domain-containing protein [Clostridia bacterium]